MFRYFGLALLFICLVHSEVEMPDVPMLTDDTFDKTLTEKGAMMVMFFAPWCGHCKRLGPTYNELGKELKDSKDVYVAKVDCTASTKLCSKYGVRGYPTLKHFTPSKVTDYEGDRSAADLRNFLKKIRAPAFTEFTAVAELEKFIGANKPAAVGLFADKKAAEGFIKVAEDLKFDIFNFAVFIGDAKDIVAKYKLGSSKFFIVNDEVKIFEGAFDAKKLTVFLKRAKLPAFGQLNQNTYRNYADTGLPLGTVVVEKNKLDEIKPLFTALASKFPSVAFCYMFSADGIHKYFNLPDTYPSLAINKESDDSFFLFKGKFEAAELEKFLTEFEKGKLKPSIKSQPVPKNDDPEAIYELVGTTLEEAINDPTRDVLVKFYASWCGHCKKLEPIYKQVAKHFAKDSRFRIARINVPENTVPKKYGVQGFPTVIMFRANNKKPERYNGDRTYDDLVKFVLGGKEDLNKDDAKKEAKEAKKEEKKTDDKKKEL